MRGLFILLLAGVSLAGWMIWREHERSVRIQAEIDALKAEADKIQRENEGLSEKIMYFASPDFQEREAKEKLGYRRLEEEVVLIPEGAGRATGQEAGAMVAPLSESSTVPNYRKWWELFFPPTDQS